MHLFWEKGYRGASIDDLERATGTTRFSIYRKWGDKNGLLAAALDRYLEEANEAFSSILYEGGLDAICELLDVFGDDSKGTPYDKFGCLAVTLGTEAETLPPTIHELLAQYAHMMRRHFGRALEIAKGRGEIAIDFDIDGHADMLAVFNDGLAHATRTAGTKAAVAGAVESMKRIVLGWALQH